MRRFRYITVASSVPLLNIFTARAWADSAESTNSSPSKPINNTPIQQPGFGIGGTRANSKSVQKPPAVTLDSLTLISGSAHKTLSESISHEIGVPLCKASVSRFADGEVNVQIHDNIRGQDVYIIQPCASPVNDSIMELLLTVSCARRANVRRITAVIPYFGYKHHRRGGALSTKHHSRFLWSGAGDFATMLQEMGVDRVITVDLQRPGQGLEACFFDNSVPVETILSTDAFIENLIHTQKLQEPISVVAPNAECFNKARKFQTQLQKHFQSEVKLVPLFANDTTAGPQDTTQLSLLGNQPLVISKGDVVVVDDMVDTAGTIANLSRRLHDAGARDIYICASHGLFTEHAMETIDNSPVKKVIVSDSLPLPQGSSNKIEQVSLAKYLGHVILTEHFRTIISEEEIFEDEE